MTPLDRLIESKNVWTSTIASIIIAYGFEYAKEYLGTCNLTVDEQNEKLEDGRRSLSDG